MGLMDLVIADAPTVLYTFDESSGNLLDKKGSQAMTPTGTLTRAQAGILPGNPAGLRSSTGFGGGYFTGPDAAIWEAVAGNTGQFSLECVVQPDVIDVTRWIVAKGDNPYEFGLSVSATGVVTGSTWTGGGATVMGVNSVAVLAAGKTSHLLMTYSWPANEMRVYVDGQKTSGVYTGVSGSVADSPSTVQIGRRGDGSGATFSGKMGLVAHYATALPDARCMAHYREFLRGGVSY